MRACPSLLSIFGVVPEEIREWKPDRAQQALVIKQKGNILPAKMGPVPSINRVSGGISMVGRTARMPPANSKIVPSFTNVLRTPRGANRSHTGITEAVKP